MSLKDYFRQFSNSELQVIGPFFNSLAFSASHLKEPVVYVDGGAQFRGGKPGFSVGDGDSSTVRMDEKLQTNKSFSDLAFVLHNIPSSFSVIYLFGFLGHRSDHEIMNFAEAHEFLKNAKQSVKVYFDKKIIALSPGIWNFAIQGIFSVFGFEEVSLQLTGQCDYQILPTQPFSARSSQGLSNQGRGEIRIVCDKPVFLFLNADE